MALESHPGHRSATVPVAVLPLASLVTVTVCRKSPQYHTLTRAPEETYLAAVRSACVDRGVQSDNRVTVDIGPAASTKAGVVPGTLA